MALTPRKFSQDSAYTAAWVGSEEVTGLVDVGGGVFGNRRFSIGNIQKLINRLVANLGTPASAGAGAMRYATDTQNGAAIVVSDGAAWRHMGSGFSDVAVFVPGNPDPGADVLFTTIALRPIRFAAGFSGSAGHVGAAPAAQYDIDVRAGGASIGSVSISTGGVVSFATAGGSIQDIGPGTRLSFHAPGGSSNDPSISDIAFTLAAVLRV